jgi:ATP-dependent DNA ligase
VEALLALPVERFVLDGELVVARADELDFLALMARLHPAASRVERLRAETPATFVAFDLVSAGDNDLSERPFAERRVRLEQLLAEVAPPLALTPATADAGAAEGWPERFEGVVAKHRKLRYEPGKRAMVKVKRALRADCVVAGFAGSSSSRCRARSCSASATATSCGMSASRAASRRRCGGSCWSDSRRSPSRSRVIRGSTASCSQAARPGGARPGAGCGGFRQPSRFVRWRPDREPGSCLVDQLEEHAAGVAELLP